MSKLVEDILRESISAETVNGYLELVSRISNHDRMPLIADRMTDREPATYKLSGTGGDSDRLGNPHDDPLYRLLVKEAQERVSNEQIAYKERLKKLRAIRKRVEQFMQLLQTNEELQKRIEGARNRFTVQTDLLTQLREHIQRVQDKRILVSDKLKQIQGQQQDSIEELKQQRKLAVSHMKDLSVLQAHINMMTTEENSLREQIVQAAKAQQEEQKVVDDLQAQNKKDVQELARLATLIPKTEKALQDIARRIGQKTSELASLRAQISAAAAKQKDTKEKAENAKQSVDKNSAELQKKRDEQADNEAKKRDLKTFSDGIQLSIDSKTAELRALEQENSELAKQLEQDEKEFAAMALQIQDSSGKNTALVQQIQEKEAEKEKLRLQEQGLVNDLQTLKADIESRKSEIRSMQEKLKKAEADTQSLESSERGAIQRQSETELALKQFNKDIAELEKELAGNKEIEQALKDGQQADQKTLTDLLKEVSDRTNKVAELDIKLAKLASELTEAKNKAGQLALLSDISKAAKQRNEVLQREQDLEKDINRLVSEIGALGLSPQQMALAVQDPDGLGQQLDKENSDLEAAKKRLADLEAKRNALHSEGAKDLIRARKELNNLLQLEKDQTLSTEEQERLAELQAIVGAPATQESIDKKLADLRAQVDDLRAKAGDYTKLRDMLSMLQGLKDQKGHLGQEEVDAQKARQALINDFGLDPSALTDEQLPKTLAEADAHRKKLQEDISALNKQKDTATAQIPQLAKLSKDLAALKEAEKDKTVIQNDLNGLIKRLSDGLAKYDLGGLPDPTDLKAVGEYIKKLQDLQDRSKLLELQRLVDVLEMAVADLDSLKRQNPGLVKTAMDQILKGSAPSAEALLDDLKKTLARHGLSTKGDPKEVAEAIKRAEEQSRDVASELKTAADRIIAAAETERDNIQKLLAVLAPYVSKMTTIGGALADGKMQLIPGIQMALKHTGDAIAAIQPLTKPTDKTITYLRQVEQKLKTLDGSSSLTDQIKLVNEAVDQITQTATRAKDQNKLLDDMIDFMVKQSGGVKGQIAALGQVQEQIRKMKTTTIAETAQLTQLAEDISGAIRNMVSAEAQQNRLGIRMATISFSFHKDARGNRIQMGYRDPKDYTPDHQSMARVLQVIKQQVDAITSPGTAAQFIKQLLGSPSDKVIAEVDDIVLTIWVYDLLYEFRQAYSANLEAAHQVLNEIQIEVNRLTGTDQLEIQAQLRDIKKAMNEALVNYQTEIGDITKLFFVNMQLPSKRSKPGEEKFPTSIDKVDRLLQPFYKDYQGLEQLLPDGLFQAGLASANNLSLILNNMQDAYTQTALLSSKNPTIAADAFTQFMKEFKNILGKKSAPLIALYNTPSLKQAQSLDAFVREVLANTIKPSQTLLTRLKELRDSIVVQKDNSRMMTAQRQADYRRAGLRHMELPPLGAKMYAFTDKKPTRSFGSIRDKISTALLDCVYMR